MLSFGFVRLAHTSRSHGLPLSLVPEVTKNSIDKLHFIRREEVTAGCREPGRTAASRLLHRAIALEEQSFSHADGKTRLLTT